MRAFVPLNTYKSSFYKDALMRRWDSSDLPDVIFVMGIMLELDRANNHNYFEAGKTEVSASVWAMNNHENLIPLEKSHLYENTVGYGRVVWEGKCGGRKAEEALYLLTDYLSDEDSTEDMQLDRQEPNFWSYYAFTTAYDFIVRIW